MHLQTTFELSMVLDNDKFHRVLSSANYLEENEEGYFDQSLASKGILITYRDSKYKKKVKLIVNPSLVLDDDEPNSDKLTRKLEILSCYNSIVTDHRNKKTKEPTKMKKYNAELKETIVRLHLSEGSSMASLEKEYNLSKGCVSNWVKSYNKECQNNEEKINEKEHFSQLLELKKEVEELKKENLFLKKQRHSLQRKYNSNL